MGKVRVACFGISLDGYGAGPDQDSQNPLGVNGVELMEWFFPTRVWRRMQGHADGETGVDNQAAERGFVNVGAWILGRNMFGPVRGPWPDESWRGRIDRRSLGYHCVGTVAGERATHVHLEKSKTGTPTAAHR